MASPADRSWKVAEVERQDGVSAPVYLFTTILPGASDTGDLLVDINPAFTALTGYTRADAIGHDLHFLFSGPDIDVVAAGRIGAAVMAGRDASETLLAYRTDGSSFWNDVRVAAVRDAPGTLTHAVGIHADVTARVVAQQALAQERALLDALINQLPDAVYVKDTASRFLRLNQATARQLGVADPSAAIGQTDHAFFPVALADEYRADEQRVLDSSAPMLSKTERLCEREDCRCVLTTKAPLRNAGGEIIDLVGANRDITKSRLQMQETGRLAAIVDSSNVAIIGETLDGAITSWNPAAERLYGYPARDVVGRSITILLPSGENEDMLDLLRRAARGEQIERYEARRQARDGRTVDVSLTISPVRGSDGHIVGASAIGRDVTALRQLQQERDQLYADLQAEIQRAAEIQAQLLPRAAPNLPGYEFAGICLPATSGATSSTGAPATALYGSRWAMSWARGCQPHC